MDQVKLMVLTVTLVTAGLASWLLLRGVAVPPVWQLAFWVALLVIAELLPVSLGLGTVVSMSFPIAVAVVILYEPGVAMLILGLGFFDSREFRREVSLLKALFNRAQYMLAGAAAASLIHFVTADVFASSAWVVVTLVIAAAVAHTVVNLGLVALVLRLDQHVPLAVALTELVPRPVGGFFLSQAVLAGLGAATAAAFREIGVYVAALLIPLLFARLSFLGARAQQELSERVRKQQEALLGATEKVFQERENERKRIAADIHDSSLQMFAAAAYACGNSVDLIDAGKIDEAQRSIATAKSALEGGIGELRDSLMDLRRSSLESGGLMETVHKFADEVATLWQADIKVDGSIEAEPPVPVALAAFQILQEGLINALKHSGSSAIDVRISQHDGQIRIVVEDHGEGFDPATSEREGHVGMKLMGERAASVGGRVGWDSELGRGTRLEAILPAGIAQ